MIGRGLVLVMIVLGIVGMAGEALAATDTLTMVLHHMKNANTVYTGDDIVPMAFGRKAREDGVNRQCEEIMAYKNLSSYTPSTVTAAIVRFHITSTSATGAQTASLFEQNKGAYNPAAIFSFYDYTTAWSNNLGSYTANAPAVGWYTFSTGASLVTLVQNWVTNNALNNKGLILGGNFTDWNDYWKADSVQLIMTSQSPVPLFTTQPANISITNGTALALSPVASGVGNSYQWYKGVVGSSVAIGAPSATPGYSKANAYFADSGSYYVIATNGSGSDTSAYAFVTVTQKPQITTQPVTIDTVARKTVSFSVKIDSVNTWPSQGMTYQWKINSVNAPASLASGATTTGGTTPVLTIANAVRSDSNSTVQCVITTTAGGTTSTNIVNLKVTDTATFSSAAVSPISVAWNGALSIPMTVSGAKTSEAWYFKPAGGSFASTGIISDNLSKPAMAFADTGDYRLYVTNRCGIAHSPIYHVFVTKAPSITLQPSTPITRTVGQAFTTSVTVDSGYPRDISYQWKKNGADVLLGTGGTTKEYTISSVARTDSGSYTCFIMNSTGNVTSSAATLSTQWAPTLTTNLPIRDTVNENSNLTLTVATDSKPPATYQWYKAGAPLIGETNASYTITNASAASNGWYYVVATNAGVGAVTSIADTVLTIIKPVISSQPQKFTGQRNDNAVFRVTATGTNITYQWQTNASGSWQNLGGATVDSFVKVSAQLTDSGYWYRVVVTNRAAVVNSDSAQMIISNIPTPPLLTMHPGDTAIFRDSTLTVNAAGTGIPSPIMIWKKGATILDTAASFSFSNSQPADSGDYCVVAVNASGRDSAFFHLSVWTRPAITVHQADTTVEQLQSVLFSVGVSANAWPTPTIRWYHGATVLGSTNSTYSIASAVPADSGLYICEVMNNADTVSDTMRLTVIPLSVPRITIDLSAFPDTVAAGATRIYTVAANGVPAPTYAWYKGATALVNGGMISGVATATLTLADIQPSDSGLYSVRVSNSQGADTSAVKHIVVKMKPQITVVGTETPSVTVGDPFAFSVTATGIPSLISYTWMKGSNPASLGAGQTYSVAVSAYADSGSYTLLAWNGSLPGDTSRQVFTLSVNAQNFKPSINTAVTDLLRDTVIAEGARLVFPTLSALGNPLPIYSWYRYKSADTSRVSTNADYLIASAAKANGDSAWYYGTAANTVGADTTPFFLVSVYRAATFSGTGATDLNKLSSMADGSTGALSVTALGDGLIQYRWYKNGTLIPGATGSTLQLGTVTVAGNNDSVYHCTAWSSTNGRDTIGAVARSTSDTLRISKYYNPFQVSVSRFSAHDTTRAHIVVSGDSAAVANLATGGVGIVTATGFVIAYAADSCPDIGDIADVARVHTIQIPITTLKPLHGTPWTLDTVVNIPGTDLIYFSSAVKWHEVLLAIDTFSLFSPVSPPLFLGDTIAPVNPLAVSGSYAPHYGFDSADVTISGAAVLDAVYDSLVVLRFAPDTAGGFAGADSLVRPASELRTAPGGSKTYTVKVIDMPQLAGPVFVSWHVVGTNGYASPDIITSFEAGVDRPVYRGVLSASLSASFDRAFVSWEAPDTTVDSIKIWKTTGTFADSVKPTGDPDAVLAGSVVRDTLTGLQPSQTYRIGIQVLRYGFWSYIGASQDSVTTPAPDTSLGILLNVMHVDSSWFDKTTNALMVTWSADTTRSSWPENMQLEWAWSAGTDSLAYRDQSALPPLSRWSYFKGTYSGKLGIVLADTIRFDTTWHVGLWLRAHRDRPNTVGLPRPPIAESSAHITVGHFNWQVLHGNSSSASLILSGNNDRILIARDALNSILSIKVKAYERTGSLPKGFVDVGAQPVKLLADYGPTRSRVGIAWGTIPAGVSAADIAMYRDSAGKLWVVHADSVGNGYVWASFSSKQADSTPYLVLADTLHPSARSLDTSDIVAEGALADSTRVRLSDNIANLRWYVVYGSGKNTYSQMYSGTDLNDTSATVAAIIRNLGNPGALNAVFGCRALLIVSDGAHFDTLNISKQVASSGAQAYVHGETWTPIAAPLQLADPHIATLMASTDIETDWIYDTKAERIFRWYDPESSGEPDYYEYSKAMEDHFNLDSAHVLWLKSKKGLALGFGAGLTPSLKDSVRISLAPKAWTDFALPFPFPIVLGDVFDTLKIARDSLEIYHWRADTTTWQYAADRIYVRLLSGSDATLDSTLWASAGKNAYTIYNHYGHAVDIVVPPMCDSLSAYRAKRSLAKAAAVSADMWWRVSIAAEGVGTRSNAVSLVFDAALGKTVFHAASAPAFPGGVTVNLVDSKGGSSSGLVVGDLSSGGLSSGLRVSNTAAREAASFRFNTAGSTVLPAGWRFGIFDPEAAAWLDTASAISLAAGASRNLVAAVGSEAWFNTVPSLFARFAFGLGGVFPNPSMGIARIAYVLPNEELGSLEFALYDLKGRSLWQQNLRDGLRPGPGSYSFEGRDAQGNIFAAGMYVLRMSLKNPSGGIIGQADRLITRIR